MIRIGSITLREILLPLVEPFRTAKGLVESRRIILLEIVSAGGETAWSECVAGAAPEYTAETVDSAWDILSGSIIESVIGRQFAHPEEAHRLLEGETRRHPMACAAVEMGLWAIAATHEGEALASFLAKSCDVTSEPRSSVEAGVVIGLITDSDELASRVERARAEGYRRIKLKISPNSDIESIRRVSGIVGNALAVDCNGSFSIDDPAHVRMLRELDALGMSMIEQPLSPDSMTRYAELQKMLATPICLDESISSEDSVKAMISLHSARIVNLKPGRVGGLTEAIAIHDRCAHAGIPVWCGGMLESGIGRAYNIALASLPNFTLPGDLSPSARYWQRDVITTPWTMSADGLVDVPLGRNGIGVEVDADFVDTLTVRELAIME